MDDVAGLGGAVFESAGVIGDHRHQILSTGEEKDVGLARIVVLRQPLVSLAGQVWQVERPTETERTVSGARIVGERELRTKARAPGADVDGNAQRAGARDRIRRELLSHSPDGAPALRQRDLRNAHAGRRRGLPALVPVRAALLRQQLLQLRRERNRLPISLSENPNESYQRSRASRVCHA